MKRCIGVFDSGIGGITILEELKAVLPNENFIYYSDSIHNPYGEKSDEELFNITSSVVDKLIDYNCSIIVIACNTATTRCIKFLREKYRDIIFIGTVPAIKIASDHNYKNTLVMATPATINSKRTSELVKDNKRIDQNIYLAPCVGLANAIEKKNKGKILEILKEVFEDYYDKDIDSIVLGCTHYPFIKKEILELMPNVTLLDGANGVARETKRQLELNKLVNTSTDKGKIKFYNSLDNSLTSFDKYEY